MHGQVGNIVFGIGTGMYINTIPAFTAYVQKNFLQFGDISAPLFFDPITSPPMNYTAPANNGNGKMVAMNNIGFPTEYAVSGWYKWTPMTSGRSEWHEMFRLTINSPTDLQDLSRLGDRTLAAWTGTSWDCYHFTSYSYSIDNPATGPVQQYANIKTGVNLPTWAFVYFGYSR